MQLAAFCGCSSKVLALKTYSCSCATTHTSTITCLPPLHHYIACAAACSCWCTAPSWPSGWFAHGVRPGCWTRGSSGRAGHTMYSREQQQQQQECAVSHAMVLLRVCTYAGMLLVRLCAPRADLKLLLRCQQRSRRAGG